MANCGLVLTRGGCNVRPLSLTGADDETRSAEISRQYLDGLVVLDVNPERIALIRRLRDEAGLKAVIQVTSHLDADFSDVDSFCFDFFQAGVEAGSRLLAEGRTTLFFLFLNPLTVSLLDGIRSVYASAGKRLDVKSFTWETPGVFDEIRSVLRAGAPDSLYVHGEHWTAVRGILEATGIDTEKRCRLIAESHAVRGEYRGILLDIPFEKLGSEIGERMTALFKSGPRGFVSRRMPVTVTEQ
jgi:DNA-binding LacI/PurR family transcriptional regulator